MSRTKPARMALIGLLLIVSATMGGWLALLAQADGHDTTATIQGKIDNLLGEDLDGVTVVAFNPDNGGTFDTTVTDEGEFRIKDLMPGHYVVRFTHPMYLSEIVFASIGPGGVFQLQESLTPLIGTDFLYDLTGDVTDSETTNAIPGVKVFLMDDNGNLDTTFYDTQIPHIWNTMANGTGAYEFNGMANGSYYLRVEAPGYITNMTAFDLNGTTTLDIALDPADDNRHKVYPKDANGKDIDLEDVSVWMYDYDTGTWVEGQDNVLSYNFYPSAGDHVFFAMPTEVGTYFGGLQTATVAGPDLNFDLELSDWEMMDRHEDYTFTDWETVDWTVDTTYAASEGRMVGQEVDHGLYQPLTGFLYFDIDRIWGDDDGNADLLEIQAYRDWEIALDAAVHNTEDAFRFLEDGEENYFTYQEGTYNVFLTEADGSSLPMTAIDSQAYFMTSVSGTYTTTVEDMDEYRLRLWAANSNPNTYSYSYHLAWPDQFETTFNTTGNRLAAEVTGTPDSDVVTSKHGDLEDGGNVTYTVTANVIPVPVIKVTNDINIIDLKVAENQVDRLYVAGPDTEVNLSALDSDDTFDLMGYEWTFPGPVTMTDAEVSHTFAGSQDENVTVMLKVTDTTGATNDTELVIYIDDTKPTIMFDMLVKETQGADGEAYSLEDGSDNKSNLDEDNDIMVFDAGNSTDGFLGVNGIVSYEWNFSDEWTDDGVVISRTFSDPGMYTVKLTITDAAGNTAMMSKDFIVNDVTDPSVSFTWYSWNETDARVNQAGTVGEVIQFNGTQTTDNVEGPLTFDWIFGDGPDDVNVTQDPVDGSDGQLVNVTFHKHKDAGYPVVLTVTDAAGNQGVYTRTVTPSKELKPDLIAVSITKATAGVAKEGEKVEFKIKLSLVGMDIDQDIKVGVYKGDISDGILIGENLTIKASDFNFTEGEANEIERTITWNKAKEFEGSFYVFVDSGDVIDEGDDEDNNVNKIFMPVEADGDDEDRTWLWVLIAVVLIAAIGLYYALFMRTPGGDDY